MRFERVGCAALLGAAVVLGTGARTSAGPDVGAPEAADAGRSETDYLQRVNAEVKRHAGDVGRCAEKVAADPCARGALALRFDVQPDGRVSGVHVDEAPSIPAELRACVEQAVSAWRLPPPPGVGFARIRYPFSFGPTAPPEPEQSCGARILDQGTYDGARLPDIGKGGPWWAVCARGEDYDLRPVRVAWRPVRDEVAGDSPTQRSGRDLVVSGCAHAAFLVQGVYGATAGTLSKARYDNKGEWPARTAEIALDRVKYHLSFEGEGDGPWRIVLAGLGAPAPILSRSGYALMGWSVRWAGDLDGDQHPDFLLEEVTESGATILHLFVTRAAARGADVRELAQTTHGGC